MSNSSPKTVLITGASSGIGKSTAFYLGRRGYRVIATSRVLARLDEVTSVAQAESLSISPFELDVNQPSSVSAVVPQILEEVGTLDSLVNNAGYGLWGCLEDLSLDEVKAQFETNLFGVLRMCQAVLPHMRERRGGTIVNVGSVLGIIGNPTGGAYVASKFALHGLTKVLRMEVAQFGIRAVLIEPGLFRTKFSVNKIIGERVLDPGSAYYSYTHRLRTSSTGNQRWSADPIKVAKTIDKVLKAKHPRQRYAVGVDAKLGAMAARLLPDGILEYLVKRVVGR